ncbi:MAG: MBL fold metallo-hydrolase [Chloroflexota bacterium]|nr:MBL fold metallo-hydrolase [Chloroflexota bacterium]
MTSIHVLGAGTPTPTPHRFGSAFVIKIGSDQIMLDCGPAATHKLVKSGLWPTNINHLFFTHHHFDHDIDYPCFLLCRWDQSTGKEDVLKVYGPELTERITKGILDKEEGLFAHDWIARVNHPLSQRIHVNRGGTLPRKPPYVQAKVVGPGKVHSGKDWEVTAASAEHVQPYLDSLAYRFETPNGSIVFTGDTQPCESVQTLAHEADMLLCMCWDEQSVMDESGEAGGQCGTEGAAKMAQNAEVKKLVLVHIGPHLSQDEVKTRSATELSKIYEGEIVFADEMMSLEL